ncbi:MAG: MFS transporter [Rhodoferax sp.]|nr:MFS transporter [Rhodoferax sp.]
MLRRDRLIPALVASPLFLQNLDTSAMVTALPAIASALGVPPLHLNLAITAYLLSLALFLPLSGWLADRIGARRVFCLAIGLFSLASGLCGLADSVPALVLFRVLQGLGGALMLPVGRLILLRAVPPERMVAAMIWFSIPPVLGRLAGPLFGGLVVTWTSWRWIFLVNIPFGLLAIALTLAWVDESPRPAQPAPFDARGFALLAPGLTLLMVAMETAGRGLLPAWAGWLAAAAGAGLLGVYWRHSRRSAHPLIDLGILRHRTFRASVVGGTPLRIAIGAVPFLLPLMLQLGFGLSPLAAGLLTLATALGGLSTRVVLRQAIQRFGFRPLLIGATVASSLSYAGYGLFTPATPQGLMFTAMLAGGLATSTCMVCLATLGFSEVPRPRMSHATALSSMAQQLSNSFGVVLAGALLLLFSLSHGGDGTRLQARDFSPVFWVMALLNAASLLWFVRLHPQAGDGMR